MFIIFKLLWMSLGLSAWSHCFYLLFVLEYGRGWQTTQLFQDGKWRNKASPCRNDLEGVISSSWKCREISLKREHFTIWICKLCPLDADIVFLSYLLSEKKKLSVYQVACCTNQTILLGYVSHTVYQSDLCIGVCLHWQEYCLLCQLMSWNYGAPQ